MGLFSKKICSICGAEIGFLSNKKIADGDMCKDCRSKLSAWFDEYRKTTVSDIIKQIQAREENKKMLNSFQNSHFYGENSCILIDNGNKRFVAVPKISNNFISNHKTVTSVNEIKDKNPDIIEFSQVTSIDVTPSIEQHELKQTINNQKVSYNPKHFEYKCNFYVKMTLNHPYVKNIKLTLNPLPIRIECHEPRKTTTYADEIKASLLGFKDRNYGIENKANFKERAHSLLELMNSDPKNLPEYSFGFKVDPIRNWKDIQKYNYYFTMGEEIKKLIEGNEIGK